MIEPVIVAIAYYSGYGHTARQAVAVVAGVESAPDARADLRDIATLDDDLWVALAAADAVNGDKLNTLTSMSLLAAQHGMHWVTLGLPPGWVCTSTGSADDLNRLGGFPGAMAQSPSDLGPDLAPSEADLRTAEHLGRRVARTAVELAFGRRASALSEARAKLN
jgi:NAD(P)H dehydrogenase (quinone)